MASLAVFSLFFYMASLAIALTWYGVGLMNLRWFALFTVLITSASYWAFSRRGKLYQWEKNDNMIVLAYLIITFLTVIAAENPLFSGLRWVSHGLMILTLLILLKNSLTLGQAASILQFLKVVISVLLLVSWLKPLSPTQVKASLFAGVFGSSNSLGQVAAVGAILYLHGFLTDKARWIRIGQVWMSGLALWIMWLTGSRSAFVAFLAGLGMMHYFYPKLLRGKIFVVVLLLASMMIALPGIPGKVQQVILRSREPVKNVSEQLFITRRSVWEASWTGFKKRPLLGWGFGATSGIPREWKAQLTAVGTINRDAVNDTLFVLEGSGVVGLCAYALLVVLALRQIPTRRERHLLGRIHSPPSSLKGLDLAASCHLHAVTFIVATSLLLMVQFDNTAMSAGNFMSALVWLCVTLAGAVRKKAMADELFYQRRGQLSQRQSPPRATSRVVSPWVPSGLHVGNRFNDS